MRFSERGESSRKIKHQGSDIIYKKRAMLNEGMKDLKKINAKIKKRVKREKKKKNAVPKNHEKATPNSATRKKCVGASKASKKLQLSLLFAKALSNEIKQTSFVRKKKEKSLEELPAKRFFPKCRLINFAASETGNNWQKLLIIH